LHAVRYGVLVQVFPNFISFIIGFGGGFYLSEQINGFHYSRAGTAIGAIVIVVWAMDFLSAEVRKRLT
jgi:ABC-type phosphate/phosphonate transport system permease subunit